MFKCKFVSAVYERLKLSRNKNYLATITETDISLEEYICVADSDLSVTTSSLGLWVMKNGGGFGNGS